MTMTSGMALAVFAVSAGVAIAQPTATDLGTLVNGTPATASFTIAPAMIQWYTFTTPADAANPSSWLDVVTNGPVNIDTMIGLYDAAGNRITSDDDDGPPTSVGFSSLSYGSTNVAAPGRFAAPAGSVAFNGRDGARPAGLYYLAVTGFSATFNATGWSITTAHTRSGQVDVWVNFGQDTLPYPPTGVGSATPNPVIAGSNVLLRVTVTPGGNPTATSNSVEIDLQALGGSATQQMYDDQTNGDENPGDNIFSYSMTVPAGGDAAFSLPFTVSDSESRSSGGNLALTVQGPPSWDETANGGGDAGDVPATAQSTASGTGTLDSIAGFTTASDVDLYLINICDVANFSATTFNSYTTGDTQLWIFNLDGTGVASNDDVPDGFPGDATLLSRVSGTYVPATGNYYLAISRYNRDPLDEASQLMWVNTPFNVERAPDGPGAAGTVSSWTGTTATAAGYRILLTGACFPVVVPPCDGDVNCDFALNGIDVETQELAVGGEMTDYCQPDPDFNGDFALNGGDVEAVEIVVGGGDCP